MWSALQPLQHSATLGGVVWCGGCGVVWCGVVWWVWCGVVWCALRDTRVHLRTNKVVRSEWILSDHNAACSRRDNNSMIVACMHTRDGQGGGKQELDAC